ncbi:MAG TPA: TIGR00300 family protein [Chthoniobacteraceae bacterium]|jgi:lysine-ketoglutarate reductase/saccharopine dehydrogenase-like protein (TIGR00300 family)|nr:TIGR00300 family protein [Chthoniobacteraceae bacterium]
MRHFLVCPPDHYGIEYVINPWMEGNVHRSSEPLARRQWHDFTRCLAEHAATETVAPQAGQPDMVFTANAGLVVEKHFVPSRFFHPERRGEEAHFRDWFAAHGYTIHELPPDLPFEGAGDALWDATRDVLWAAYGMRTELAAHPRIAAALGVEVLSLRLVDPRFYHLDTCFCPLENGTLLYWPPAFDAYSNLLIENRVPAAQRLAVSDGDAIHFACNAVDLGSRLLLNRAGEDLCRRLREEAGVEVLQTPLDEFLKAGGGAKCLTLRLDEPAPRDRARAGSTVELRELQMRGHLLDSGLLDRALETTIAGGGSFRILDFALGRQRQSTSSTTIQISAPAHELLEKITAQLLTLGAVLPARAESDATLATVTQDGVAPDDFHVTTIYPTEVRVRGQWVRVAGQRMDGVIVVNGDGAAQCRLIRDLRRGEEIVVGSSGLRTVRPAEARERRGALAAEEFSFMGAGVSSERRVELVVEQIAWELQRLRERGGRTVVVPGPVVIHTGAGEHLAWLIRHGYVQALLSGNAVAVHDIEQALLGTSLGVDLQRGVPVHGGHRHHLRAINAIRRSGSIAAAVADGTLTRGVFYECVQHGVPFSLAGSIRDDGPLPDTQMDLLQAQADYARLLQGAEMILMLSSMLHSIGVGNMTPAGVRLVCVDINPAVVTKLADRGSLESLGVVTDVGLFLSLLVQRLKTLSAG